MVMSNVEGCSTYMPLKPKELSTTYQPLLRNEKEMGYERKERKEPAEYLEMLPKEDLTAQYENVTLNV